MGINNCILLMIKLELRKELSVASKINFLTKFKEECLSNVRKRSDKKHKEKLGIKKSELEKIRNL